MSNFKVYTFFVCLIFRAISLAQSPNISWYSVNEGLSQSMVTCFYKDRTGLMWIGTGDGLNSFDGRNFVKYRKNLPNSQGLENSTIRQITEDEQGKLWVVTDGMVYIFDPVLGRFDEHLNASMNIGGWQILGFKSGIAKIYSTDLGIFYYNAKNRSLDTAGLARNRLPGKYDAVPFINDVIMIAGPDGISKATYKENKLAMVEKLISGDCHAIKVVNGRVVSSCYDKLVLIDSNFRLSTIQMQEEIFSILPYDEQGVLVGTSRSLFLVNPISGQIARLNIGNNQRQVKVMWNDHVNIWIGTDGAGFGIWSPHRNKFTHCDLKNGIGEQQNSVFGIMTTKKYVWHYLHERGIVITDYAGMIVAELKGPGNCFAGPFLSMRKFDNSIYIGSCCGLYAIDENDLSAKKLTLFSDTVLDIVKTGDRIYTFGWNVKEYLINGKELIHRKNYRHNSVSVTKAKYAVKHGNTIWGTDGWIIFSMDGTTGKLDEYRFDNNYPRIISITITPKNEFALTTYDGIYVYKKLDAQKRTGRHYLKGEIIYGILATSGGQFWCTSNSGIYVLDENYRVLNHFIIADGLQSLEFNSKAYARSDDGFIFFGGINGTSMVHENGIRMNTLAPGIRINSVLVNEQEVPASSYASTLEFNYTDNVFSAKITALEYTIPERVKYRYKLEGWDNSWSNPVSAGYVRYTGTRPGNYRLFARACNGDGVWSAPVLLFNVRIIPPWWATWWFRIAAASVLIALGGLAIRHFARRKLKRQLEAMEKRQMLETERSRISRDMHDDIGAELTKINLLSKGILMREKGRNEYISKIADTSDMLIQNMREIIWALNTNNDTLAITAAYLHEYALNLLEDHNILLNFETRMQNGEMVLGANIRRNMFLIYKEALNNILKHSGATEIVVVLTEGQNAIGLMITDNGRGFDPAEQRTNKNGLLNMQARAREINASIKLDSIAGKGSSLKLDIPMQGTS